MTGPQVPTDTYHKLFRKCLLVRVPASQFESLFTQLHARTPIPTSSIAATILSPSLTSNVCDPVHLDYVSLLVSRDIVSLASILTALLKTSAVKSAHASPDVSAGATNEAVKGRETLEQYLFLALAQLLKTQKPRSAENVWTAVAALSEWMEAVMAASGAGMLAGGAAAGEEDMGIAEAAMMADVPTRGRLEALGELVIALGTNEDAVRVLSDGAGRREKKVAFQTSLSLFTQYIQVQNPPLAERLEALRQAQLANQSPRMARGGGNGQGAGSNKAGDAIDGMMMGLGGDAAVAAGPVNWSRAHLYISLNSLLAGRPQVDDNEIVAYLFSRYKDENNEMLSDFVTAVIDVMSFAILRSESPTILFALRSFVVNKVPLLLRRLCASDTVFAISQAFTRSDVTSLINLPPNTLDPYSAGSSSSDVFSDISVDMVNICQEFLFACALHGVIGESDIQPLLGELPMGALPAHGRYNSQVLLHECMMDPLRLDKLVEDEIEAMDGNSGAVCLAIFEQIRQMCVSRETLPLHRVCSVLTRKPASIDVLLLFVKAYDLLQPLCTLLDTWHYEEDQGEYQPVYEEFGAILLLVLTIVHRYGIRPTALPCAPSSFIPKLLTAAATPIELLSPQASTQLGGWLKELFENEGISDDLLSSCPPQSFHTLVPTIFSQSLMAVSQGVLDLDTVRECFAFLLEPFLLPAVISGLIFLSHHLWATLDNPTQALTILTALIVPPPSMAAENKQAHTTVVSIAAQHLSGPLREHLRRSAAPDGIPSVHGEPLLNIVRPLLSFRRAAIPSFDELHAWTTTPHGGITAALAAAYNQLLLWSAPGSYTPRLLLSCWRLLGAVRTIEVLITEATSAKATNNHLAGAPEDVVVAMVLSALPDEERLGWMGGLKVVEGRPGMEGVRGEVVVGVIRRCELQARPYEPKGVVGLPEDEVEMGGMDVVGSGGGNGGGGGGGGIGGMNMGSGGMGEMGMGDLGMGMEGMDMMMGGGLMFDGMELS